MQVQQTFDLDKNVFIMQVLNSGGEWEQIVHLFKTEQEAITFFNTELDCFCNYKVTGCTVSEAVNIVKASMEDFLIV